MRAVEFAQGFQGKGIPRLDIPVASRGPQDLTMPDSAVNCALVNGQLKHGLFALACHQFSVLTTTDNGVLFRKVNGPIAASLVHSACGLKRAIDSNNGPSSAPRSDQQAFRMGGHVPNFPQVGGDVLNRFHTMAFLGMPNHISFPISRPKKPFAIHV